MKMIPGRLIGDKLVKNVIRKKHFLRFIGGYAWSQDILEDAKKSGVKVLELIEDSGKVLTVSLETVLTKGRRFQFGAYEPQIGIPETSMTSKDPDQLELL